MSEDYMNQKAMEQMSKGTDAVQTYLDSCEDPNKITSKNLMSSVKGQETKFIILDRNNKMIYPSSTDNQINADAIYNYFLNNYLDSYDAEETSLLNCEQISIDSQKFFISYEHINRNSKYQPQYIIAYQQVTNVVDLLTASKTMVLRMSIIYSLLFLFIMLIIIAPVISSIHLQCEHAEKIGNGEFDIAESESHLKEINMLNDSMNSMAQRLKEADEKEKIFFQNVSHELRTPIMSISGYAQGIKCKTFDDNEAAQIIMDESDRLSVLVNDILLLSKMDSQKQEAQFEKISAEEFCKDCQQEFTGIAQLHNIKLNLVLPEGPDTHYIIADGKLLMQAVSNILSNGMRYAHTNVTMAIASDEKYTTITISNDGQQFTEDELAHMFERFYKGNGGQYGIGLSIAQSAVEYMGGELSAQNIETGVQFVIQLVACMDMESAVGREMIKGIPDEIRKVVLSELNSIRPGIDYEKETRILEDEVLPASELVLFIFQINEAFDIEINSSDILPHNFNSVDAMVEFISGLLQLETSNQ
jgi:signal transduction histidine kinase/acyl carrier protein